MKVPMKWLKEYVDIDLSAEEYAARMVMTGTAVEGVEKTGGQFDRVVVGYVVSCVDHPNSDHLHLCMVDVGAGEPVQIVCGAPNVHAGMRVAAALDGAHLDLIVAAYVFKLLAHIGYRPDLTSCVSCGDEAVSYFSAAAGGLLCASCPTSIAGAEEVDGAAVGWLRALMAMRFDELAAARIDAATAALLLAFAHVWAAVHLDSRLRALEFMLGC